MEIKISSTVEGELQLKKEVWSFYSKKLYVIIAIIFTIGIILIMKKNLT